MAAPFRIQLRLETKQTARLDPLLQPVFSLPPTSARLGNVVWRCPRLRFTFFAKLSMLSGTDTPCHAYFTPWHLLARVGLSCCYGHFAVVLIVQAFGCREMLRFALPNRIRLVLGEFSWFLSSTVFRIFFFRNIF